MKTYKVDELRAHRRNASGTVEYEVKWAGYTKTSWEPSENISKFLKRSYWRSKRNRAPTPEPEPEPEQELQTDEPPSKRQLLLHVKEMLLKVDKMLSEIS